MRLMQAGTYTAAAPSRCGGRKLRRGCRGHRLPPFGEEILTDRPPCRPGHSPQRRLARHAGDRLADPQTAARCALDLLPALCGPQSGALGTRGMSLGPQVLDQLAGVDAERAGEPAGAVCGAGLEAVVREFLEQRPGKCRPGRLTGDLPPQDDPLPRGRGQRPARADRLAHPALDTAVTESSTGGVDFRSRRWTPGSRLSRTPGARTPSGSASCFTFHIISVAFTPHSRSTNGAMLRPVPCSAFSEPSYLPTTSSTSSAMNAS